MMKELLQKNTEWDDAADLVVHEAAEAGLTPAQLIEVVRAAVKDHATP